MRGKELDLDSMVEAIARKVCDSIHKELKFIPTTSKAATIEPFQGLGSEAPRHAVSIREAARLLSISVRTLHNYIALNTIRTVRVGRRVLIPMKTVSDVASKGIPSGRVHASTGKHF
jgi:excisionase family DNA binding protein